jgi:hypothetical protein
VFEVDVLKSVFEYFFRQQTFKNSNKRENDHKKLAESMTYGGVFKLLVELAWSNP